MTIIQRPRSGEGSIPAHYSKPKLTAAQRDEIGYRRAEGERVYDLAAEYEVNTSTIRACTVKFR
jgi:hypothetical protein